MITAQHFQYRDSTAVEDAYVSVILNIIVYVCEERKRVPERDKCHF